MYVPQYLYEDKEKEISEDETVDEDDNYWIHIFVGQRSTERNYKPIKKSLEAKRRLLLTTNRRVAAAERVTRVASWLNWEKDRYRSPGCG